MLLKHKKSRQKINFGDFFLTPWSGMGETMKGRNQKAKG